MTTFSLIPAGDCLTATLSPADLGFTPSRLWNPSPSTSHRTAPYELPMSFHIGIYPTAETGAKFSPCPYAVVVENDSRRAAVGVEADAGWHLWNGVDFAAEADGTLRLSIDLEGHSVPAKVAKHARVRVLDGDLATTRLVLLTDLLRQQYPAASAPRALPDWWLRPIYCGWGDQVTASMWLEGPGPEPRAIAYCIQGLYERWIRRLDEAEVPFGTTIIDHGWSPAGSWQVDTIRWPDLKGFIAREHQRGRKVLLWLATWLTDGLPDEWCCFVDGQKLVADPSNPDYLAYVHDQVTRLISPDGLDADGFKIDQLAYSPCERKPRGGSRFGDTRYYPPAKQPIRLHGPGWGTELLYTLQKTIYDAAKAAKPDALVTSSTVHPYFHDTFDMTRLHDTGAVAGDPFDAMGARADLARAALPPHPIDTDDWISRDYDKWLRYTSGSRRLGVPCIFYAEHFMLDWQNEPATKLVPLDDLRRIAAEWRKDQP